MCIYVCVWGMGGGGGVVMVGPLLGREGFTSCTLPKPDWGALGITWNPPFLGELRKRGMFKLVDSFIIRCSPYPVSFIYMCTKES